MCGCGGVAAQGRNTYPSVRKALKLIVDEDPDRAEPEDMSHVYSGYAPLSCRLVQHLAKPGGVRSIEEVCHTYTSSRDTSTHT